MSVDPLISDISLFGANFAPSGWAFCEGQLMAIAQNTALFSLLGTIYGGDGRTTFALPDLRGRHAIGPGRGPGLSFYPFGGRGGQEYVTLNQLEMPAHTHSLSATSMTAQGVVPIYHGDGDTDNPQGATALSSSFSLSGTLSTNAPDSDSTVVMQSQISGSGSIGISGSSQSHENRPPFTVVPYIIAMLGTYPSRN